MPFNSAGLAFLVAALLLRPASRLLGWVVPDGPHAASGFSAPVIGGIALWCAVAVSWLLRPSGIDLPVIVLALFALRVLAAPGDRGLRWTHWVLPVLDFLVCAALVQKLDGNASYLRIGVAALCGVALLQGTYALRSLDGLGAVVIGAALCGLATLSTGAAQWLATTGAAATAGLLLLNLPLRANRRWRIQSGQGGSALLALLFGVSALLAGAGQHHASVGPVHLLWLLPLPLCELLRLLAGRQPSHERLLGAGFSVTALFLLYALMSLVPVVVLLLIPAEPVQGPLLGVLAVLVLLWFYVLWRAPQLMWLLPWRLRRIDVAHKD